MTAPAQPAAYGGRPGSGPRPSELLVRGYAWEIVIVQEVFVVSKGVAQGEAAKQVQHGGKANMDDDGYVDAIPHGLP